MKKKQWLLLAIILLPSALWLILETSTIQSKRLPIYGPKKVMGLKDTMFYTINDRFFAIKSNDSISKTPEKIDVDTRPLYAIAFIKTGYDKDSYRLTGLWEYLNYKRNKIEHIPFYLITEHTNGTSKVFSDLKKLSTFDNVFFKTTGKFNFDSLNKLFFMQKPYYIDYSFFVLIDAKRQIRGYYDGRYVAEIKRLIDEYQHLRLKEEKQRLIDKNEINTKN